MQKQNKGSLGFNEYSKEKGYFDKKKLMHLQQKKTKESTKNQRVSINFRKK